MTQPLQASKKISLGAMVIALNLLALYAASTLPTARIACLFLSSVFSYALLCEKSYFGAFIAFIGTILVGLFLLPQPLVLGAYVALLGHYGIIHVITGQKMRDKGLRMVIRLLYCNLCAGAGILIAQLVFRVDVIGMLPVAAWIGALIMEAAFVLQVVLYGFATSFYELRIRRALTGK